MTESAEESVPLNAESDTKARFPLLSFALQAKGATPKPDVKLTGREELITLRTIFLNPIRLPILLDFRLYRKGLSMNRCLCAEPPWGDQKAHFARAV